MSREKVHTYGALRNGICFTTRCHQVRYVFLTANNMLVVLKNTDPACTDILLFANIKIQLTGTFEVNAKIKF
jgi:hypothetical protein